MWGRRDGASSSFVFFRMRPRLVVLTTAPHADEDGPPACGATPCAGAPPTDGSALLGPRICKGCPSFPRPSRARAPACGRHRGQRHVRSRRSPFSGAAPRPPPRPASASRRRPGRAMDGADWPWCRETGWAVRDRTCSGSSSCVGTVPARGLLSHSSSWVELQILRETTERAGRRLRRRGGKSSRRAGGLCAPAAFSRCGSKTYLREE